jgi:LPXTG-motif cell wall-anchored protein
VEELAYTGAADWVFPAGLGLLGLGAAALITRRFITTI